MARDNENRGRDIPGAVMNAGVRSSRILNRLPGMRDTRFELLLPVQIRHHMWMQCGLQPITSWEHCLLTAGFVEPQIQKLAGDRLPRSMQLWLG